MRKYICKIWNDIRSHFKIKLHILFFLSSVIPVLFFLCFIYPTWYNTLKTKELNYMEDRILAINNSLDQILLEIEKNMSNIFTNSYIISAVTSDSSLLLADSYYRISTVEAILKSISNYSVDGFSYTLIDHSGQVYSNGSTINLLEDFDGSLCTEIKNAPAAETYFTARYTCSTDKKKTLTFARSLYVNGEICGVLIVDISPELLDSFLEPYKEQSYMTVITNSAYDIIYTSNNFFEGGFDSYRELLFTSLQSPVKIRGDMYEKVHAQAFLSHCNTCILIPRNLIFQDSIQMRWQMAVILLIIFGQTFVFSDLISHSFSKQIITLKQEMVRFINTRKKLSFTHIRQDEISEIADGILYMEEELEKLIEQIQENEKKKRNLEFKALQQQINPHMIYNTLNTITRLAQLQGVSNIEEICCSFSNMLKLISKTTGDFITIRQEIAFIQSFITLKQYNSYKEYSLTTEISDEVWDKPIIKLLLHPLIENSITHGFTRDITIGRIMISIYASGGYIHIIMEDNGSGISEAALRELFSSSESDSVHAYKSTGIHNCMERLWLQYGSSRHFSIDSDGKTFTRIFIDYPEMEEVL